MLFNRGLFGCLKAGQGSMQPSVVWMPVLGHGTGSPRSLAPRNRFSAGPGWRGRSTRMHVSGRMQKAGGKQANQSTEVACWRLHAKRRPNN
jgi:hypothetical protein